MSICGKRVQCVCKECKAYKLKWGWCTPCKVCDNFQIRPKKVCLEEKMRAKELEK